MSVQLKTAKNEKVILKSGDKLSIATESTGNDELDNAIAMAGYAYDPKQDIFYSTMNPWQRNIGYCRLYDEAAAPLGMIIDCEPIHFKYHEKEWMIGFWKGQYDLVTGAEIGVYTRAVDRNIHGFFNGAYYDCVSDIDRLNMSYTLKKNGNTLFTRTGEHWWLTGFKVGEFSEPSDLTMEITITLHNVMMRNAFVTGLWDAGYPLDGFRTNGATVSFTFSSPHTTPPATRTSATDRILQRKNQLLCEKYQDITGSSTNLQDKVKAIEALAPEMYDKLIRTGKSKQSYEKFSSWFTEGIKK